MIETGVTLNSYTINFLNAALLGIVFIMGMLFEGAETLDNRGSNTLLLEILAFVVAFTAGLSLFLINFAH